MSIARAMVIANSTHYTRISMRTCQLILAVASNSEAVYPYHLVSVIKMTNYKLFFIFMCFFTSDFIF